MQEIANILVAETRPLTRTYTTQTDIEKAEGTDSSLEETTTWVEMGIHTMPIVKPKKVDESETGLGLRYLGQYHHINVKTTARGKALID